MNTLQLSGLSMEEQFRLYRLQVFDWGTFSGVHDIPIDTKGFLFVGPSGSGKSTLLDAFSALLVPPRWLDFNAAAHEVERSGRDRSIVTYVRGAWAEQKDGESGTFMTRYLRPDTTWSALALSYRNQLNRVVTLVQVFWVRGKSNNRDDFKRHYLVFERDFDLSELESFGLSNFDVRKLKQTFPTTFIRDKFRPYCDHFCHLLGIESERALRLLHKTQSAKNLGDLNAFLRDFMLDKPQTFAAADQLVEEFSELNAAHQTVIMARQQIETLLPAREEHIQLEKCAIERHKLEEIKQGLNPYCEHRKIVLLQKQIAELSVQSESKNNELIQLENILNYHNASLKDLEQQHRDQGGDRIEQNEIEQKSLIRQRDECLRRGSLAEQACRNLGWTLPSTPQGFAEIVSQARGEIELLNQSGNQSQDELLRFANQKHEAEFAFQKTKKEIESLRKHPSNIPADMLELRYEIANDIGIHESVLSFVGELIEVLPVASAWQGAIERVLHGFALSILVEEQYYSELSRYLNHHDLKGRRIVYYRTEAIFSSSNKSVSLDSLIAKLELKICTHTQWLEHELRKRFDYVCVNSLRSFHQSERALTQEGQIKHSQTRHEKDDRRTVNDRRYWVLGFNNRDKLALFETQAQGLAAEIAQLSASIYRITENNKQQTQRALHCKELVNLTWQELDPSPFLIRLSQIEKNIKMMCEGNTELQRLNQIIAMQQQKVDDIEHNILNLKVELRTLKNDLSSAEEKLNHLIKDPALIALTMTQQQGLDDCFSKFKDRIDLNNIDRLSRKVFEGLSEASERIVTQIHHCTKIIENRFRDFIRSWPSESEGLDATLAAAPDFFAKLRRLETDGLPAHEARFFDLLKSQSQQNIAALLSYLNDARKVILERMGLVNESLGQVPFNQNLTERTFLHIEVKDRHFQEVKEFKQMLQQTLSNVWSDDTQSAEERFLILRSLVHRLSSQEADARRWRELVLDVRQHVEFVGREQDEAGKEIEIYRSGTGKSGGQRQKLATTCLAAALRYQLGGHHQGIPLYAPVILDEAFDKADNEFTALAMNIFVNFGFQMIVATPLKSVMTLEPFIGGACFVQIGERQHSSILLIEYDHDENKLKLKNDQVAIYEVT